jgi:hypothetical protein
VCVGEILSLPWFSKELKNDLSKNNWLHGIIFILFVRESIFVGWGFPFLIVLVCLGTSYLCVTILSNPIYLAFRELSLRVGCLTACSRGSHQICSLRHLPHNLLSFGSLGTKINKSKSKQTISRSFLIYMFWTSLINAFLSFFAYLL